MFESTDNIVEIVYDLLTNTDYGAGDIAGIKAVNVSDMQESANYLNIIKTLLKVLILFINSLKQVL